MTSKQQCTCTDRCMRQGRAFPSDWSWRCQQLPYMQDWRPAGETTAESWRCFHCNEVFTDRAAAQAHFGPSLHCSPGCHIDMAEYRRMEEVHRRHCEEDTELHRALHSKEAHHQVALRREEEKGYARGLDAAKRYPETLGLRRAQKTEGKL